MPTDTAYKLMHCHHCDNDLSDIAAGQEPNEPMNFCFHCRGDIRDRNAVCLSCHYVFFDGLLDQSLRGHFCPGCGRSLNETLIALVQ